VAEVTATTQVRLLIVEDHPIYRDGLTAAFSGVDDVVVVGAVSTVREAREALAVGGIDVMLLDLGLPDGHGLDLLGGNDTRGLAVVVLTMTEDRFAVLEALRAGARGYLLKGAGRAAIVDAVRRAAAGGAVFDEDAADIVIALAAGGVAAPHIALGITEREAGVLRLVATGLTNQAIAARLGLAPKTVRNVVSTILVKLGVSSREQAIARARVAGL
jgi:DNA-binding NarL/FixJ family response regulator